MDYNLSVKKIRNEKIKSFIFAVVLTSGLFGVISLANNNVEQKIDESNNENKDVSAKILYLYSNHGDLLAEYAGKFDLKYGSKGTIFYDDKGIYHWISYGDGIGVIDEISDEELQEILENNSGNSKVYTKK